MSKLIKYTDSNRIVHMLTLQEGDMAVLEKLRTRVHGDVPISISAASAHGDVIFVTQKNRVYEVPRNVLFA